ncbi:hypothetical protein HYU15_00825 [Candidatus Woesearchaeota archaeon]|nr:hypothetical protein [Candidatus Woesearchaeota archaeon]
MAKKKVASALAFVAIAAILIAFAQAQAALAAVNDFTAYASPGITACGCGTAEGSITVRNTGDFENLFVISASGEAAEFVSIFPQSFTLKPGEQETVHEFVSAPCGAEKEKSYELGVDIRTDTNLQKAISQKVIVSGCSNIALALSYQNNTGCRCNKLAYVFTLNNTGSYAETYRFSVDRLSRQASITPRETTLGPGNYETVRLSLTPDCGQETAYFNFAASAGKSGFTASMPLRIVINDSCYGVANYTAASGKMPGTEKYAVLLLYLPLAILFILAALFAAVTLSKAPKPAPRGERIEKAKAKPRHYPWEQRFRTGTEKLSAGRMERAERKGPLTVNAALAVLVIAVAAALVALVSSQIVSFGKANISNASVSNISNVTSANITAANVTGANETVPVTNITANITPEATANVTAKLNFTFPHVRLPKALNITGLVSGFFRREPNAAQRNMFAALKLPTINLTRAEKAEAAEAAAVINLTGIKEMFSSLGSGIGGKLKGLAYRNETASAEEKAEAAEGQANQQANESITAIASSKAKAAASKLKSFAAAYYVYVIAGFAVLALIIIVLRMAESRSRLRKGKK